MKLEVRPDGQGCVRLARNIWFAVLLAFVPLWSRAATPTYYFHGTPQDQVNKEQGLLLTTPGSATFDLKPPTGTVPVTQTGTPLANSDFVANPLAIFWTGPFSGTVNGVLDLESYWSTTNAEAAALGETIEVSVFADPDFTTNSGTLIGRALIPLKGLGPAPTLFSGLVPVSGTVTSTLVIQVVPQFVDAGNGNFVSYDSTLTPSSFRFLDANPNPPPPPAPGGSGLAPRFSIFNPAASQIAAGLGNPGSSEPSIGVSWNTGKVFHQSILQTLRVSFLDSCPTSPDSVWDEVESPLTGTESFDPILYTDSKVGRTFVSQLLFGTTESLSAFSDDDGRSWTPSQGAGIASGIDHQTLGGGPFHAPIPSGATYPNAVYYCAQDLAAAGCALSVNGGLTYGPAVPVYTSSQCGGLHGHIKVGPDGTAYLPNKACGTGQGVVVSEDNGVTWNVRTIPGSLPAGSDPSVAVDKGGRLYVGLAHNNNLPVVAASDDHGRTWKNMFNVGASLGIQNTAFPAVVAGDTGRASFAYLGTSSQGDLQSPTFPGVWHLYLATTYDGGATWVSSDATPNDPVQRGCIWLQGGSNICRNLLDFMDATVDAQGRILVGFADGCTGPCVGAPPTASGNAYTALAAIARQTGGRRMFAQFDPAEPTIPSSPSLTVARNGAVAHLSWSEGNNGGSAISNYQVLRSTISGQETLLANAGTATTFDDPTIDPGTTYFYKVVAVNGLGSSCGSDEVQAAPTGSSCALPGVVVVSDATGDQKGAPLNTALDIQSVSIAEPYFADGSRKLFFTMKVADLSAVPANAEWRVLWNSPAAPAGQFYVGMSSDNSGNVTFEYGTVAITSLVVTAVGQFTTVGSADAQSHFTPDGTITIVVPNAAVGSPRAGDILGGVVGRTYLLAGSAVTSGRVAIDVTDALASPYVLVGNSYCTPPVVSCLEDDDPHIVYSNGWHKVNDPDASAGHFRVKVGSGTATLSFDVAAGKFGAVTYNYAKSPKGGLANVSLDGVPQGTISYQGSSGTTNAPQFGFHSRYGGLRPGPHTLQIQVQTGAAYVDSFCLESSSSIAQPTSGPGQTTTSVNTLGPGQQLLQSITLPAGTLAISVVAEPSAGVPIQLVLIDPSGAILQTADASSGFAVIERPATQAGIYIVKLVNTGLAPVGVWTAATPFVSR